VTDQARIQSVTYSDWQKGAVFAKGLTPNQGDVTDYQSLNMQVYVDGTLGPRPYLKRVHQLNGTPVGTGGWLIPQGSDTLLGFFPGLSSNVQRIKINDASPSWSSKTAPIGSGEPITSLWTGFASTIAFNGLSNNHIHSMVSETLAFHSRGYWDPSTNSSFSTLADPPVTSSYYGTVPWKDRLFIWGNGTRVLYSDAAAFTTFTSASQFFDVGYSRIIALYPLRDALLIATEAGVWYALTGNTPEAWSLREIGRGRRPDAGNRAAVFNNAVWFIGNAGEGVTVVTPEGVNTAELSHVRPLGAVEITHDYFRATPFIPMPPVASEARQGLILPYIQNDFGKSASRGLGSIDFVNQSAHRSHYWATTTLGYGHDTAAFEPRWIYGPVMLGGRMWFAVNESNGPNNTTDCIALYSRDFTLNRPSRNSDPYSGKLEELAGVNSQNGGTVNMTAGTLGLREYAAEPGYEVRIRQIIMDVSYWGTNSGEYEAPNLTATIYGAAGGLASAPTTTEFETTPIALFSDTSAVGASGRIVWRPVPTSFQPSIRVEFSLIRSIAFRKIVVEYEIRPTRPRA
jgi:hypothetical protein